jgi:hypothetical protein
MLEVSWGSCWLLVPEVGKPSLATMRLSARNGLACVVAGNGRGAAAARAVIGSAWLGLETASLGVEAAKAGVSCAPRWAWAMAINPSTTTVANAEIRIRTRFMAVFLARKQGRKTRKVVSAEENRADYYQNAAGVERSVPQGCSPRSQPRG